MVAVSLACLACGTDGEPGPAPLDCGLAPPLFDVHGDIVQGESDDGCVRIERTTIELGDDFICKACPFEATRVVARVGDISFELRDDLSSVDRDDVGALTYEASHHNWADVVTAHGDGDTVPTTFAVRIRYDVPANGWDLEVLDPSAAADPDDDDDDDDDDTPLFVLPIVGAH
jgi:hypothetical protein